MVLGTRSLGKFEKVPSTTVQPIATSSDVTDTGPQLISSVKKAVHINIFLDGVEVVVCPNIQE